MHFKELHQRLCESDIDLIRSCMIILLLTFQIVNSYLAWGSIAIHHAEVRININIRHTGIFFFR